MLSVKECREHIGNTDITDEQIEAVRDHLYVVVENLLDTHFFAGSMNKESNFLDKLNQLNQLNQEGKSARTTRAVCETRTKRTTRTEID